MKIVVAITGASGSVYGIRLLEALEGFKQLIISDTGARIIEYESGRSLENIRALADQVFDDSDLFAPTASGTNPFDAMVIIPCSEGTVAKIAAGIADNLITRTAAVALKERRKLIIVPRETPISSIMLENELKLSRAGATILPASPGFYGKPSSLEELVDFVVGKVLDQLGQPHRLFKRWGE